MTLGDDILGVIKIWGRACSIFYSVSLAGQDHNLRPDFRGLYASHGSLQNPTELKMSLDSGVDGVCGRLIRCVEGERATRENLPGWHGGCYI